MSPLLRTAFSLTVCLVCFVRTPNASPTQPAVMYQLYSSQRDDYLLCAAPKCYSGNLPHLYVILWHEGGAFEAVSPSERANMTRLYVYYSAKHEDCISTTSDTPPDDSYTIKENNSFIFSSQVDGSVPLRLYQSPDKREFLTTATQDGAKLAERKNYTLIETLGYVTAYPTPINNWDDPTPEGCPLQRSKVRTVVPDGSSAWYQRNRWSDEEFSGVEKYWEGMKGKCTTTNFSCLL